MENMLEKTESQTNSLDVPAGAGLRSVALGLPEPDLSETAPRDPPNGPPADTPDRRLRRGPRRRIDWGEAAALLADGVPTIEVARFVGCSRQHIWRILRSSNAMRVRLGEERARIAAECGAQVEGLRRPIAMLLEREVLSGNVRVAMWLADRLGLAAHGLPGRKLPPLPPEMKSEPIDPWAPYYDEALDPPPEAPGKTDPAETDPSETNVTQTRAEATLAKNQTDKPATVAFGNASSPISKPPKSAKRNAVSAAPSQPPPASPPASGARTR
jgi:hypothetical protein